MSPAPSGIAEESTMSSSPPRPTEAVCSPPVQGAGFVRRALAFMIDLVLLHFLYFILFLVGVSGIQLSGGDFLFSSASLMGQAAPFVAAWFLLFIGYFTFFHAVEGQTPAKKILRIKVVNDKGMLLPHWVVLLRSCGYFLSFLFFGFGFLMALFGKKRGLHDRLTGAYVVLSSD
jgi:uncharacterized RDD family membrane protein YckC